MSLKPMYDNLVIKPISAEEKTASGLYLGNSDTTSEFAKGEVLAVGTGYRSMDGSLIPLTVAVGENVIYRKGTEVSVPGDDGDVFLVSENNVLAVL